MKNMAYIYGLFKNHMENRKDIKFKSEKYIETIKIN